MAREEYQPEEQVEHLPSGTITKDEKQWAMLAHLSALIALGAGALTFLGPLIVWQVKKDESEFVAQHGKEALNFQLTVFFGALILVAISVATCGAALIVTVPLLAALGIYNVVMVILAGMKANEGEAYEYPATIRLIK